MITFVIFSVVIGVIVGSIGVLLVAKGIVWGLALTLIGFVSIQVGRYEFQKEMERRRSKW